PRTGTGDPLTPEADAVNGDPRFDPRFHDPRAGGYGPHPGTGWGRPLPMGGGMHPAGPGGPSDPFVTAAFYAVPAVVAALFALPGLAVFAAAYGLAGWRGWRWWTLAGGGLEPPLPHLPGTVRHHPGRPGHRRSGRHPVAHLARPSSAARRRSWAARRRSDPGVDRLYARPRTLLGRPAAPGPPRRPPGQAGPHMGRRRPSHHGSQTAGGAG